MGDWGLDKSHGGGQKIHGGVLSWGVLLMGVTRELVCSGQFWAAGFGMFS